jgi:hypothetical protein
VGASHGHSSFPVSLTAANRITGSSHEGRSLPNLSGEHALNHPMSFETSKQKGNAAGEQPPQPHEHYSILSEEVKLIRHLFSVSCRFFSA